MVVQYYIKTNDAAAGRPCGRPWWRFFSLVIPLLVLFFTGALFAEEQALSREVQEVAEILETRGYASEDIQPIFKIFQRAEEQMIPSELLISRLEEGAAKGASIDRLEAVLRKDLELLRASRQVFETTGGKWKEIDRMSQWKRAVHMLAAGVAVEHLERLIEVCKHAPRKFRPASLLYVSLDTWGLASSQALRVAEAFVDSPLPTEHYGAVTDLYRRARSRRMSPDTVTERIVSQVKEVRSMEALERRVLAD